MNDNTPSQPERVLWEGHTSWMDQAVLFIFMAAAAVRTAVAIQAHHWGTASLYLFAVVLFLGIASWFHYAYYYRLTSSRIWVHFGHFGRNRRLVKEFLLKEVTDIHVRYELLNRWFDLGKLEIANSLTEEFLVVRGVPNPEELKTQLERWVRAQRNPWGPVPTQGTPDHAR
ncbi:MAG: PH domain-containing protein [Nitrospiraceae bacterium]